MTNQFFTNQSIRIGHGIDIHAFAKNRKLIIGGVEIDYEFGLDGHSDADVLSHAIADALLGAARLGDIGELFPDTNPSYKDIESLKLLEQIALLLNEDGYKILDIDSVIEAQEPKLSPYRSQMQENIAMSLGISPQNVGVKATTTEHLGFVGQKRGIVASAVCLICRCSD